MRDRNRGLYHQFVFYELMTHSDFPKKLLCAWISVQISNYVLLGHLKRNPHLDSTFYEVWPRKIRSLDLCGLCKRSSHYPAVLSILKEKWGCKSMCNFAFINKSHYALLRSHFLSKHTCRLYFKTKVGIRRQC